jgi:hypothetical protein
MKYVFEARRHDDGLAALFAAAVKNQNPKCNGRNAD